MFDSAHPTPCYAYSAFAIHQALLSSHQFRRWLGLPVYRTAMQSYGRYAWV